MTADDHAEAQVVLTDPDGLHVRPAAEFAALAATFASHLTINGANGKSVIGVLGLGLDVGSRVTIIADGPDAAAAVAALTELLNARG